MSPVTALKIREGGRDDAPAVLDLLDGAVRWLVARGRTGQWGTEPWSASEAKVDRITAIVAEGVVRLAVLGDEVVGALVVGPPHDYTPPVDEPELYVRLLVTSREHTGLGIGTALLDEARSLARADGVSLLRVDCYGGDDRSLVRFYERAGFTATTPFEVNGWPGQLLEQRI